MIRHGGVNSSIIFIGHTSKVGHIRPPDEEMFQFGRKEQSVPTKVLKGGLTMDVPHSSANQELSAIIKAV